MSSLARTAAIAWAKRIAANPMTVFLDTETLGKPNDSEICDIGIVGIDGRVWFDELIRPSIPIPAEASAIHGITNEMVAKAPPWSIVATAVGELLRDKQIVIFNAEYDRNIISHANERTGHDYRITGECAMLEFARFMGVPGFKGQFKWHRLDIAAAHFGIPPGGHRALADAETARKVVLAMAASREASAISEDAPGTQKPDDRIAWASTRGRLLGSAESARASPVEPAQAPMFDLPDPTRYTR